MRRIGNWQLDAKLGEGGQGITWLARHVDSGARAVVKELKLGGAESWKQVELFEREARVLETLQHPGIPRYIEHLTLEEEGRAPSWYLVQAYVRAPSLATRIAQRGRVTPDQVVAVARQVLEILAYLHGHTPPVVHRDIKPANVLWGEDGAVWLVDFGAVKDRATRPGNTQLGDSTVVGTFGYMAPEQLMGRATPQSDLYGLGTTLIHLASGIAPGDLPMDGLRLQFRSAVSLPPGVVTWLEALVSPEPRDRPASAAAALAALEAALAPAVVAPVVPHRGAGAHAGPDPTAPSRRAQVIVALAALSFAGLFSGAMLLLAPREAQQYSAPEPGAPGHVVTSADEAGADETGAFRRLAFEIEGAPGGVHIEPLYAIVRDADSGYPTSTLYAAVEVRNTSGTALFALAGGMVMQSANQIESRVRWSPVDPAGPPIQPGESRVMSFWQTSAPNRLQSATLSVSSPVFSQEPPRVAFDASLGVVTARAARTQDPVVNAELLPSGVEIALLRSSVIPPDRPPGPDPWVDFDVLLDVTHANQLRMLGLRAICVLPGGVLAPWILSTNEWSAYSRPPGAPRLAGDRVWSFGYRVRCPLTTESLRWDVVRAQ